MTPPWRKSSHSADGTSDHAGAVTADPDVVAQEAQLFRTRGVAPFISQLERQGALPPWFRTIMQAADQYALAALTSALATREDITATLAKASVPLLLLAGDKDPQLLSIRRTAAEIPGSTLVELPGCGHLDAFVRTDLTFPRARHFLARCP